MNFLEAAQKAKEGHDVCIVRPYGVSSEMTEMRLGVTDYRHSHPYLHPTPVSIAGCPPLIVTLEDIESTDWYSKGKRQRSHTAEEAKEEHEANLAERDHQRKSSTKN
jgi:hypothetical protein